MNEIYRFEMDPSFLYISVVGGVISENQPILPSVDTLKITVCNIPQTIYTSYHGIINYFLL